MDGKKSNNNPVTYEELTLSNMYSIEAIVRLLERKGLITQKEILDEMVQIKKEQHDKQSKN